MDGSGEEGIHGAWGIVVLCLDDALLQLELFELRQSLVTVPIMNVMSYVDTATTTTTTTIILPCGREHEVILHKCRKLQYLNQLQLIETHDAILDNLLQHLSCIGFQLV